MRNTMIRRLFFVCMAICLWATAVCAQNRIVVSKKQLRLTVLNAQSDTLRCYRCAVGTNKGNKQAVGDLRTPEGTFTVGSIEDSSKWKHDFNDGAGLRPYAYGPYFVRLKMPVWRSIGIHGTCFPESIGTRSSEGCIRLRNEDLIDLIQFIRVGTEVRIEPDN